MRTEQRDILLLLLAGAAGASDGWSYMGLGHAFVANMTGNTVLLGLAIFLPRDLIHPLLSLAFYAAGAAAAAFLTRRVSAHAVWHRAVSRALLLEALLLVAAEIGWLAHCGVFAGPSRVPVDAMLVCVAFATGMQSGAMLQLHVPGIVTTYITGTWTNLMTGLIKIESTEQNRPVREKLEFEERTLMQFGIVAFYFLSAVLTGWLFKHAPAAAGAVPCTLVLFTALWSRVHG